MRKRKSSSVSSSHLPSSVLPKSETEKSYVLYTNSVVAFFSHSTRPTNFRRRRDRERLLRDEKNGNGRPLQTFTGSFLSRVVCFFPSGRNTPCISLAFPRRFKRFSRRWRRRQKRTPEVKTTDRPRTSFLCEDKSVGISRLCLYSRPTKRDKRPKSKNG